MPSQKLQFILQTNFSTSTHIQARPYRARRKNSSSVRRRKRFSSFLAWKNRPEKVPNQHRYDDSSFETQKKRTSSTGLGIGARLTSQIWLQTVHKRRTSHASSSAVRHTFKVRFFMACANPSNLFPGMKKRRSFFAFAFFCDWVFSQSTIHTTHL